MSCETSAKALSHRLPEPRTKDEVGRLVQVLNHSFDRLERSFEQSTRFSSDDSHELKTPLTIMRGEIESVLKAEEDNLDKKPFGQFARRNAAPL